MPRRGWKGVGAMWPKSKGGHRGVHNHLINRSACGRAAGARQTVSFLPATVVRPLGTPAWWALPCKERRRIPGGKAVPPREGRGCRGAQATALGSSANSRQPSPELQGLSCPESGSPDSLCGGRTGPGQSCREDVRLEGREVGSTSWCCSGRSSAAADRSLTWVSGHMPGDGANSHRPAEVVLGQRLRNLLPAQGCGPGQPGWVSGKTGEGSLSFRRALGGRVGGLGLI